jgi:hypothetical protein
LFSVETGKKLRGSLLRGERLDCVEHDISTTSFGSKEPLKRVSAFGSGYNSNYEMDIAIADPRADLPDQAVE